jgi:uncharacterized protein YdcH (DUF465 family)
MFPEYSELIARLRSENSHFGQLFEQHCALDERIRNMEDRLELASSMEIEVLKKEKLHLKDQLYQLLKRDAPH